MSVLEASEVTKVFDEGTVAVIVACPSASGTAAGVVPIDETAPLEPSNAPLAELLVGPKPSCRNHTPIDPKSQVRVLQFQHIAASGGSGRRCPPWLPT